MASAPPPSTLPMVPPSPVTVTPPKGASPSSPNKPVREPHAAAEPSGRAAAEVGTTLLLIETVLSDHNRDHVGNWTNLDMLLMNAGRERTAAQYRDLLQRAGFHLTRVVPSASPFTLVEAQAT